jgi:hypothetical protein
VLQNTLEETNVKNIGISSFMIVKHPFFVLFQEKKNKA